MALASQICISAQSCIQFSWLSERMASKYSISIAEILRTIPTTTKNFAPVLEPVDSQLEYFHSIGLNSVYDVIIYHKLKQSNLVSNPHRFFISSSCYPTVVVLLWAVSYSKKSLTNYCFKCSERCTSDTMATNVVVICMCSHRNSHRAVQSLFSIQSLFCVYSDSLCAKQKNAMENVVEVLSL